MSKPIFEPDGVALRNNARGYMNEAFAKREAHFSNNKTHEPEFLRLTGFRQVDLEAKWDSKGGKGYTTCGDFAGHYSMKLGLGWISLLNTSDPQGFMKSIGKELAWVPIESGARPDYGDIFKVVQTYQHVGVSLDFDGDTWWTAEGGRGYPPDRYDAVKRLKDRILGDGVLGWVNIEIYQGLTEPHNPHTPVPDWLVGIWEVKWSGYKYWYFFGKDRRVWFTQTPSLVGNLPTMNMGQGKFGVNLTTVMVRWDWPGTTGTVERFRIIPGKPGKPDTMRGTVSGAPGEIIAVKPAPGSVFTLW